MGSWQKSWNKNTNAKGFSNINNLKDFDRSAKEFIESIKDKHSKKKHKRLEKNLIQKLKI